MPEQYNIIKNIGSEWGALYVPVIPKKERKSALRVVLFVSYDSGNLTLKDLGRFETLFPDKLNIVGVATDDPVDPKAKISIKKRIWSLFDADKHQAIMQRVIDESIRIGTPCYTGAVKTDYFRNLFHEWNPDVLIMNCFGQWLDSFLFTTPRMGSYNFHPSNLPKKIGAGTQPFHETIRNRMTSSPMVIHGVTEIIDMGPIIGVSPAVNICLHDGSYPESLVTLLNKITSVGGWMGVELIQAIIRRKGMELSGLIDPIDFGKVMPESVKRILAKPAVNNLNEKYEIPKHPLIS